MSHPTGSITLFCPDCGRTTELSWDPQHETWTSAEAIEWQVCSDGIRCVPCAVRLYRG